MKCVSCGVEMAIVSSKARKEGGETVYDQKWSCMNKKCPRFDRSWEKKEKA